MVSLPDNNSGSPQLMVIASHERQLTVRFGPETSLLGEREHASSASGSRTVDVSKRAAASASDQDPRRKAHNPPQKE